MISYVTKMLVHASFTTFFYTNKIASEDSLLCHGY